MVTVLYIILCTNSNLKYNCYSIGRGIDYLRNHLKMDAVVSAMWCSAPATNGQQSVPPLEVMSLK